MKPVAIFRHASTEGPGYFATFLDEHQIPWQLIAIDSDDTVPNKVSAYSGLVFMGGPMSVNDNLPWIPSTLSLIREAADHDIPLLGHCLGGQLISKALGGTVSRNPVKEIGWGKVTVADSDIARSWFGAVHSFQAFHWHGETFSLPKNSTPLLASAHCANQAYAIGKHLALQCHVEMTTEMISSWCNAGASEITASRASPAVQSAAQIQQSTAANLPQMQAVARQLYTRWIAGL